MHEEVRAYQTPVLRAFGPLARLTREGYDGNADDQELCWAGTGDDHDNSGTKPCAS
jgi:hypothetical protein